MLIEHITRKLPHCCPILSIKGRRLINITGNDNQTTIILDNNSDKNLVTKKVVESLKLAIKKHLNFYKVAWFQKGNKVLVTIASLNRVKMLDACYALENALSHCIWESQGFMTKIWSIILKPICIPSEEMKRSEPCSPRSKDFLLSIKQTN